MAHPCVSKRPVLHVGAPSDWSHRTEAARKAPRSRLHVFFKEAVRWKSHAWWQLDRVPTLDVRSDALIWLFSLLHHRRLVKHPLSKTIHSEQINSCLFPQKQGGSFNFKWDSFQFRALSSLLVWTWIQEPLLTVVSSGASENKYVMHWLP